MSAHVDHFTIPPFELWQVKMHLSLLSSFWGPVQLADFYYSLAICYYYINDHNNMKKCMRETRHFANLVKAEYSDYKFIYSEKYLREVSPDNFLDELATLDAILGIF